MRYIIRVFGYAKPWAKFLVASTLAMFGITAINLFAPYITRSIIAIMESGNFDSQINDIIFMALVLLGFFALRAVLQFVNDYLAHVASWRLVNRLRCVVYDHLQKLSMSYYHDKQTGQLMSRVINDTGTFESLIAHAVPDILTNILTLVGVFVILLSMNPMLTLLVCIPIPFIATLTVVLRKIRGYFRQGQARIAELSATLQDNFSGIKEIQVFNRQQSELERVSEKSTAQSTALIKALFYSGILNPSVGFITSIGTVVVLIAGPIIALNSGMNIADVVAFLLYLNLFYAPVATITRVIEDMQQALAGAERVFEVLDTEPDIKDEPGAVKAGRMSGEIEFKNVSFSYDANMQVLDNISFKVEKGKMIGLVGPTGVGKSTISGLIARFYDPDSGAILMDGQNTRGLTLESLREQLSIVLQDVFLFNGTIAENIAYGCDNATPEQIREAARAACIAEYIESLPAAYDTLIGERGVRLSGGQKQRISIARSVLRNSPILILDEATSAVDTDTEREIQNAINKIAGTRTLIVIAHRLSTIKNADEILVLQDGKIAERGTHRQLVDMNGLYSGLYNVQNLG